MSHIPKSAMPHAQAHGEAGDDRPERSEQRQPEPAPTTATPVHSGLGSGTTPAPLATSATVRAQDMAAADPSNDDAGEEPPLSSAGPGTATGNRQGSDSDATATVAGGAATGGQSGVDGTVTAQGEVAAGTGAGGSGEDRSTALLAAMVLGGLAAIGGLVAAVLPLVQERQGKKQGKGKKGKKAR